jgi:hypothetical protein
MRHVRPTLPRASLLATSFLVGAALLATPTVLADKASGDTDLVTPGVQVTVDLGTVRPGANVQAPIEFVLTCTGTSHVDAGASVTLTYVGGSIPDGGAVAIDPVTIGPIGGFPADGDSCPDPAPTATSGPTTVTLTAPTTEGRQTFTLAFDVSTSNGDGDALAATTIAEYTLDVVANTPPVLHLPTSFTAEGNEPNGATVSWTASATDDEDSTAPTVGCAPASGSHFALGTTTVSCTATDSGGLETTGTFAVTVVDTTAPEFGSASPALTATTTDPTGTPITFTVPTATDVVDLHPVVGCSPASGSRFAVGTTAVGCTATDRSGNVATTSFEVTVHLVEAAFDAPIGPSNVVASNASRSIPVKARAWIDGVERTMGSGALAIAPCTGGSPVGSVGASWSDGRWSAKLDTSAFGPGCWRATLVVGGLAVGSFDFGTVAAWGPKD